MKFSLDTKDTILFSGGCVGVLTFAFILPLLGQGFNLQLAGFWAAVAGIGGFGAMGNRKGSE